MKTNRFYLSIRVLIAAVAASVAISCTCKRATPAAPSATPVALTTRLDTASATSIRIATFNIENLGVKKLGKPAVIATLVGIVRKYDVVAVQEISDVSLQTPTRFLTAINATPGDNYDVLASPRTGEQPDDHAKQEQYAFYFNTRTVRVVNRGSLYPDAAEDLFDREPFAAEFATADGALKFVLLTIHTVPGKAPREIAALGKATGWAKSHFQDEDGVIILGDFNAGKASTKISQLDEIRGNELPFLWIVPDGADTTLATTPESHDRIVVTDHLAQRFTGQWGVDRSFTDGAVSDHWPVWAEFSGAPVR